MTGMMVPMTTSQLSYPYDAPASQALLTRAAAVTPGGVNSPVRAFRAVGGTPRFISGARGPYLTDVDGREYVDLVCSWGPMILGHTHPDVLAAVQQAALKGFSYGMPSENEVALAEEIVARVPPVEQVRLVSSGTEATMSALRVARGFTGRSAVVKFAGCYHGHVDALLASAGSGLATFGPTSTTTTRTSVSCRWRWSRCTPTCTAPSPPRCRPLRVGGCTRWTSPTSGSRPAVTSAIRCCWRSAGPWSRRTAR